MDQINDSDGFAAGTKIARDSSPSTTNVSSLDAIKDTVADKLHAVAGAIQQRAGQDQGSGISSYAGRASGWLDDAAEYVREVDQNKVKTDLQKQLRTNPGRALLVAGAAGLVLGILLRRR